MIIVIIVIIIILNKGFYFGDKFAAKICELFVVYDDYIGGGVTSYRAGFGGDEVL